MKNSSFNIRKMSEETGVPVVDIKKALGIPLKGKSRATTISGLQSAYRNAKDGSVEKEFIVKKWNDLVEKQIKLIITTKDAETISDMAYYHSEVKQLVLKRWIELANTVKEIRVAYEHSPDNSEAKQLALEKWDKLLKQQIVKVIAVEEIKSIYNNAPDNSESKLQAFKKWVELATTTKEAEDALCNSPDNFRLNQLALKKWDELAVQRIKQATAKEIQDALSFDIYFSIPRDSKAEKFAVKKLASFFGYKE